MASIPSYDKYKAQYTTLFEMGEEFSITYFNSLTLAINRVDRFHWERSSTENTSDNYDPFFTIENNEGSFIPDLVRFYINEGIIDPDRSVTEATKLPNEIVRKFRHDEYLPRFWDFLNAYFTHELPRLSETHTYTFSPYIPDPEVDASGVAT